MNIVIIGSTQYVEKMKEHANKMIGEGHNVRIPAFDSFPMNELEVCLHNRSLIHWADRVDIIWDQRSTGTIFDFGMAFALNKPINLVYIEPKTFLGVMEKWQMYRGEPGEPYTIEGNK